ncbi:type II secretion system F family protein [Arthrobacter sp. GMC3]|uniref:type II secretion system F family protein n=1 Tax=Arthrobacter sp. GMC3 TaxID=2058894 RepID=UPI000CE4ADA6|nr:type II secretion system F family protein [Arthrobacter sp. GMC3]
MLAIAIFALLVLAVGCLGRNVQGQRWRGRAIVAGQIPPGGNHVNGEAGDPGIADVPLLLELLGAALDAGLSIPWALRLVAGVATSPIRESLSHVVAGLEMGASWDHSWAGSRDTAELAALHSALGFAAMTGTPAAPLLYAEARQRRRQSHRDAEKRASALGVKLVIPLGLCSLPAFVCLGVIPVVVAMIPAF